MPFPEVAILKSVSGRYDRAAAIRWLQSLLNRTEDSQGISLGMSRPGWLGFPVAGWLLATILALGLGVVLVLGFRHSVRQPVLEDVALPAVRHRGSVAAHPVAAKIIQPANVARSFQDSYKVLLNRSIFAIGGQVAHPSMVTTTPAHSFGFSVKGISEEDTQFTAYVEDGSGKIVQIQVGQNLGPGRVCDITMHDLGYEVTGKVTRVEIGQSLDAGSLAVAATPVAPSDGALAQASAARHKKRHAE